MDDIKTKKKISTPAKGRFGVLLKHALEAAGMGKSDLSNALGMKSSESVRRWIIGDPIDMSNAKRVCDILGLPHKSTYIAISVDNYERVHGISVYEVLLKDPIDSARMTEIEPYLKLLDQAEWERFMWQIKGISKYQKKNKPKALSASAHS